MSNVIDARFVFQAKRQLNRIYWELGYVPLTLSAGDVVNHPSTDAWLVRIMERVS